MAPVYIRKGQEVNYYVLAMQRREDIWGEDAQEFVPERWEGRKRGWEYLPFNGGPRICCECSSKSMLGSNTNLTSVGQQFALTEAAFMAIRTLQNFDKLENVDPDPTIRHSYTVTTTPKQVLVRLHAASD